MLDRVDSTEPTRCRSADLIFNAEIQDEHRWVDGLIFEITESSRGGWGGGRGGGGG